MNTIDLSRPTGLMLALLPSLVLDGLVPGGAARDRDGAIAPRPTAGWRASSSAIGVGFAGLATLWMWFSDIRAAGAPHMVYLDGYRYSAELLVLFVALTTCLLSLRFMGRQRLLAPEYYALVLFATIGMQLMVSSSDLVLIFLGLEVMSGRRLRARGLRPLPPLVGRGGAQVLPGRGVRVGLPASTASPSPTAPQERRTSCWAGRVLAGMPASTLAQVGLGMLLIGFGFKVAAVAVPHVGSRCV
jgi:hypothetical protein